MTLMQKPRDVFGGLIVMTIGTGFLVYSQALDIGTASRMGPGYFPTILSILMILLGLVIAGLALRGPTTEHSFGQVPWRGVLLLIGAVLFFGFALRGLGLAPAVLVVVLVTAWASRYAGAAQFPAAVGRARGVLRVPVHPPSRVAAAPDRTLAQPWTTGRPWPALRHRAQRHRRQRRPNPDRRFPPWNCSPTSGSASPRRSARST